MLRGWILLVLAVISLSSCGALEGDKGSSGQDGAPGESIKGDKGEEGAAGVSALASKKECSREMKYPGVEKPYVMSFKKFVFVDGIKSMVWNYVTPDGQSVFSHAHYYSPDAHVSYQNSEWLLCEKKDGKVEVKHKPSGKVYELSCK